MLIDFFYVCLRTEAVVTFQLNKNTFALTYCVHTVNQNMNQTRFQQMSRSAAKPRMFRTRQQMTPYIYTVSTRLSNSFLTQILQSYLQSDKYIKRSQ